MTRAALALCLAAAATAAACASDPAPEPERALGAGPASGVVVTEDDRSLPRGCRPAEVAALLGELFDALNRGDRSAAAARVIDPEMLVHVERPAAGRPLQLRAVIVGLGNGLGQIEFRAGGRLVGKGAVDCETRKLVAIGLGRERTRMAPLCDRAPGAAGATVACVRHWS
jgi:hypothetical protein